MHGKPPELCAGGSCFFMNDIYFVDFDDDRRGRIMTDLSLLAPVEVVHQSSGIYLEKDIFFNAHAEQLVSVTATVSLNFRESILLRMLLADRVKKQAVIDAAWGNNGVVVTEASYHQLVRSLRKKFEEIGLPAQSIKTLPRFGLEYLRERPGAELDSASSTPTSKPTSDSSAMAPAVREAAPVRSGKWLLQLLLVICPLIVGIFIGHVAYRSGEGQMRAIANDLGIHLFDLGNAQIDAKLLQEIRRRSNRGEYVYMSMNGSKAWLNVCAGPVQEDFSFCRQDHFSLSDAH
jgi:cholera toxin transcriptional activator